jgi:hypothetical protein
MNNCARRYAVVSAAMIAVLAGLAGSAFALQIPKSPTGSTRWSSTTDPPRSTPRRPR